MASQSYWFGRLKQHRGTLSRAKYLVDFFPVREASIAEGSLFSFKKEEGVPHFEWLGERKETLPTFMPRAFGEVDLFIRKPNKKDFALRIRCPELATCTSVEFYRAQLSQLEYIIIQDAKEFGGETRVSWFQDETEGHEIAKADCFFVIFRCKSEATVDMADSVFSVGELFEFDVTLHRRDKEDSSGSVVERTYFMQKASWNKIPNGDVPRMGPNYICDLPGSLGCANCAGIEK